MQSPSTERIHLDAKDWRIECLNCGRSFEAARSDATFCSARCRVNHHREPARIAKMIAGIQAQGRQLRSMALRHKHNVNVYEAMLQLKRDLDAAIETFEQDKT